MANHGHDASMPPIPSAKMRSLVAAASLLIVVACLWVPFGVHTNPQGDGWIWKNRIASGERWVFAEDPTRAFIFVPWTLAHLLSPDTFVGAHFVLIAVFWGTGFMLFEILRRLPGSHDGLALATAALAIVYPASTWWISLDSPVDRHWAVFFCLVSIALLQAYWRRPRLPLLLGMWAAQMLSLWTNQAILPLALAVPFLLLWTARGTGARRELRRCTILWLALPIVNGLHNVARHHFDAAMLGGASGPSHEAQILALGSGWVPMARSVVVAYRKHLVDGWWHSIRLLGSDPSLLLVAVLTGAVIFLAMWVVWPRREGIDRRTARFLVIAGLLAIGLGFALFVPTSLRFTDGRSFIVSSLGAALFMPGLIGVLVAGSGHARVVAVSLMSLLVCLATVRVLDQHARYVGGAGKQDSILAAIILQAPEVRPGVFFAVAYAGDPSDFRRTTGFSLRSNVVEHALRYLYDDQELSAGVINMNAQGFVRYRLEKDGVGRRLRSGEELPSRSYSSSLIYRIRRDLKVVLLHEVPQRVRGPEAASYEPENLIDPDAPLPRRFRLLGD